MTPCTFWVRGKSGVWRQISELAYLLLENIMEHNPEASNNDHAIARVEIAQENVDAQTQQG